MKRPEVASDPPPARRTCEYLSLRFLSKLCLYAHIAQVRVSSLHSVEVVWCVAPMEDSHGDPSQEDFIDPNTLSMGSSQPTTRYPAGHGDSSQFSWSYPRARATSTLDVAYGGGAHAHLQRALSHPAARARAHTSMVHCRHLHGNRHGYRLHLTDASHSRSRSRSIDPPLDLARLTGTRLKPAQQYSTPSH